MYVEELQIENFRQFYGTQEIAFSNDDDTNVTVIHGRNGSGKTTILNAFLWLFYDEVSLPRPDHIPNERAVAEADRGDAVTVQVSLSFDHEGESYTARREKVFRADESSGLDTTVQNEDVVVEVITEEGNHKRRGNPEDTLRNILPERLREIFFFDGETIDELSAIDGQGKIKTAIQNIMGLTILERASRHLDKTRKRFEDEVAKYGSEELSELYDERNRLEESLEARRTELDDTKDSKRQAANELESVEEKLRELEDSRELQDERDDLRGDIADLESDIETIEGDVADILSDDGYLPFAMPAIEETAEMLRDKRERGEIPTEIKTQFVEDLLEIEECICGRELAPGTGPRKQVMEWRERAGSSELEETAMSIAGRLSELGESEEALMDDIEDRLGRRTQKHDLLQQKEERLSEISSRLSDADTEDIAELEERRTELENEVSNYDREIGRLESNIESLKGDLDELSDRIDGAEEENQKADLARRRARVAEYLNEHVDDLFETYQNQVRENVNDRVDDIYSDISVTEYYADIDEDYSLRILKDVGTETEVPVAQSTGERQIASLAFIAALVSLARERFESDEETTYFTGGIYPIVMDSPFGSLDPAYQERVSAMVPEMAQQVVVLVTQSQWSDAVAGEMAHRVGKEYELGYHDPDDEEYEYTEITMTGGRS